MAGAPACRIRHFLNDNFLVLDTSSLVYDTQLLVLNRKFIICTHGSGGHFGFFFLFSVSSSFRFSSAAICAAIRGEKEIYQSPACIYKADRVDWCT